MGGGLARPVTTMVRQGRRRRINAAGAAPLPRTRCGAGSVGGPVTSRDYMPLPAGPYLGGRNPNLAVEAVYFNVVGQTRVQANDAAVLIQRVAVGQHLSQTGKHHIPYLAGDRRKIIRQLLIIGFLVLSENQRSPLRPDFHILHSQPTIAVAGNHFCLISKYVKRRRFGASLKIFGWGGRRPPRFCGEAPGVLGCGKRLSG